MTFTSSFSELLTGYPLFFSILCLLLVALMILEVIGALIFGQSAISQGLDHMLDNMHLGGFDWFRIRDLPGSVVLYSFLYGFALTGLILTAYVLPANTVSFLVALIAGAFAGATCVKLTSLVLSPLFQSKTHAVSEKSLIGQLVEIKDARCKKGLAAEAKVMSENPDLLNTYVMVEPVEQDDSFVAGQTARIVAQQGHVYLVS